MSAMNIFRALGCRVAVKCSVVALLASTSALAQVKFDDDFTNGDPFVNDGVGGDWVDVSQGGGFHLPPTESNSEITLQDGTGNWQLGKMRTEDGFEWGETVTAVLHDVQITVDDGSSFVDRRQSDSDPGVPEYNWKGYAEFGVNDSEHANIGFNAWDNDNVAAMHVQVGLDENDDWGFVVEEPGPEHRTRTDPGQYGLFDQAISPANPLIITIATSADGAFDVSFNLPYGGGQTASITGSAVGLLADPPGPAFVLGPTFDIGIGAHGVGDNDAISIFDRVGVGITVTDVPSLQAGDADMDLDFDQFDLIQVQIANKYNTGQPATWGEGDWNGAPGGEPGNPPAGNGVFDQLDIVSALAAGNYLQGPYAAISKGGSQGDGQTSLVYDPGSGELSVDAPAGTELTSINIDSAGGIFTGAAAANLGGSFDNDADNNIFKATFGGSFGSTSFGAVAQSGLSEDFIANDLTAVGSLAGGGDLGAVDLVYVPEPAAGLLLTIGAVVGFRVLGSRRARHVEERDIAN